MKRSILFGALALVISAVPAFAVDSTFGRAADLTSVRAKIKAQQYAAALPELRDLASNYQDADVYNLYAFCLRKTGDYTNALVYYNRALSLDANHKGAREYLGELFVETGNMEKAKEQLAILVRLCPRGCEERTDLEKAIAAKSRGS